MISGQDCFAIWAPDDVFWSQWAKPVVFANATMLLNDPIPDVPALDSALLPGGFEPAAIVVDLPGPQAVLVGLALAERGFRPVPMFNGTSGPMAVVPVEPIEHALGAGSEILKGLTLQRDARPAFLIDADRGNTAGVHEPGRYDNRWVVLPQDFPSATTLLSRGIKQVVVIRKDRLVPDQDLTHVLLRWKEAGIELRGIAVETGASEAPLSLLVPSGFRRLWYAAIALMGLRRSSVGGFGSTVPEETSSGRSGFYG